MTDSKLFMHCTFTAIVHQGEKIQVRLESHAKRYTEYIRFIKVGQCYELHQLHPSAVPDLDRIVYHNFMLNINSNSNVIMVRDPAIPKDSPDFKDFGNIITMPQIHVPFGKSSLLK